MKREEKTTNKLAEDYGQLQLNVIRGTIKRFVDFLEQTGRKASESEKRLLEGLDFSVQQIKEYKAAAIGAEQYFTAGAKAAEQQQQVMVVLLALLPRLEQQVLERLSQV